MKKVAIEDICELNPSKKIQIDSDTTISFVPMESVTVDGRLDLSRTIQYGKTKNYSVFQNGDVLFAKITPCMENGKCAIAEGLLNNFGAGSTEFIVLRPDTQRISSKYLYYFIHQEVFRSNCRQNMTGSAGQKRVPVKYLEKYMIPIPSLAEQERIVARIEEHFSQLDAAVTELKNVKEKLNVYRQAVLKESFDCSKVKRESCKIKDFAVVQTGATPLTSRNDFYNGTIPWIASGKVNEEKIYTPSAWITEKAIKETNCKIIPAHSILVAMYGEGKTRGKCAELMIDAATNQALAAITLHPDSIIIHDFLLLFLKFNYQEIRRKAIGGVQPNLNLSVIKNLSIPLISKERQKMIVMNLERHLSVCRHFEQIIDVVLSQASVLRQTILKLAFEGKL